MTTLGKLLQRYNWSDIKPRLLSEYPDQTENLDGYRDAIEMMRTMPHAPTTSTIIVSRQIDDFDGTEYADVTGREPGDALRYSLVITKWPEWLSMKIDSASLSEFGPLGVLVHCLYEMTFVGYTPEELDEFGNMINERMSDAQEALATAPQKDTP